MFFNRLENKGNEELLTISSFNELRSLGPRNFIENCFIRVLIEGMSYALRVLSVTDQMDQVAAQIRWICGCPNNIAVLKIWKY